MEVEIATGEIVNIGCFSFLFFLLELLIFMFPKGTHKQLGPWGGNGGDEWDDGVHSGVKEITVVYGWCIDSIQVTYDNKGKHFLAEKHGGNGGTKFAQVHLH